MTTINPIYLDYNATTPLLPEVVDAMLPYLREHFGNPSSSHMYGRQTHDAVEKARFQVAALIGATPSEIVFTSGGTEANNLAIQGAVQLRPGKNHVVTSVIEHPATARPCQFLEQQGLPVTWLGVDETGRVKEKDVSAALDDRTFLVTLMHANNETGTLQPIAEVANAVHEAGALLHTDAAQSIGKVEVKVNELGVDFLSIAGHKLYAPKGVGALYIRYGAMVSPVLRGAGHERGIRPGTENVASIVGLGVACEIAGRTMKDESGRIKKLRDHLFALLQKDIHGIRLNGHPQERLPNTLNVQFPGVSASTLLANTPQIAASGGSACHSGSEKPSAVLLAQGVTPEAAITSVRLSLGRLTTEGDVQLAAAALTTSWRQLKG
ncbi:MAG: cysteine desulfurase [Deltaproteobacteria bacterium]|nr:cysteine desulfurase [Deltaproteobacteria bacterium]MBN2670776.1 cysteine desulfurase [Deltaproteobacteria bacterium]